MLGALYAEALFPDACEVARARALALQPGQCITLHDQRSGHIVRTYVRTSAGLIACEVNLDLYR